MRLGATSLNVTSRSRGGNVSASASYIISCSDAVDEGTTLQVTVNTVNVLPNSIIYWSTSNVTTTDADISLRTGNSIINANGTTSFQIPIVADSTTENVPETFDIVLRTGSNLGPEVARKGITINDTSQSPPPTYSLSTSSIVNEGTTFTSTVTTNYVADGTTLYWNINHGTTSSADFAATQGTFTVSTTSGTNASGTFDISVLADELTEGTTNETFTIQVREDSHTGTLILNSSVSINDTSLTPIYTVNAHGGATSVDEGTALQFDVTTTNVAPNTDLYWGVSSNAGDFTTSTGQVTTDANGNASFSVTPDADLSTEGPESFAVSIYTDQARQNSVVTSSSITINDTSITATYSMSAGSPSVNEGTALTLTVTTAGVPNNTDLYWRITSGAGEFTTTQGVVNITGTYASGSGTFTVTPDADLTTEPGTETFDVTLYTNLARTNFAADVTGIQIGDTSQEPTYSMALPTGFNGADEGSSTTITVNVDTVVNTTLYWSITSGAGEFSTTQGSVNISGTSTTFTVTPTADQTTESTAEYFDITLYDDGARSNQVATLTNIQINDTSQNPPATYTMSVPQGTAAPEGSATTITVTATGLTNNTGTAYWQITANSADFTTTLGTVNLTPQGGNAVGTFDVTPDADNTTEGTELFTVTLYEDNGYSVVADTIDIPIDDTSLSPPTYTLSSTSTSVNEGATATIDVATTTFNGLTNSGTLYWEITSGASDFDTTFGSVTITSGSGSFDVSPKLDNLTESSDTFTVEIFTDLARQTSVGNSVTLDINDATYGLSTTSTNVDEGQTMVVTVTTTNFGANNSGTLYWGITSNAADFTINSGQVNVTNGTVTFDVTPDEDQNSESAENFTIGLYTNAARTADTEVATLTRTINATTYTLTVSGNATSVDEGSTLTFNVASTNAYNTTLYWKITPAATDPITLSDFDTPTNGSVVIDSAGQATFTITAAEDLTTENGPEYFNVELHTDSAMNGTPVASVTGLAVNDTSLDPTWALSTHNPAVNEGSLITFNLVTTGVTDQTLYWTVEGVTTPTHGRSAASAADFNNVTSGSWAHSGGSSSFQVGPLADTTTEGEEEFVVKVRTGSSSGTVVADLEPILINDTSMGPASWTMVSNSGGSSVDEGGSFRVDVTGTNIAGTPTPQWLIRTGGGSTVDQNNTTEFFAYTGTLSNLTQNGSTWTGYFEVFPRNDNTTEGNEVMYIDLYSDNSYGTQLTDSNGNNTSIGPITVNDTSLSQTATMTAAGGNTVDEGSVMTVNVATTGYQSNKTFYWEIVSNSNYSLTVTPSSDFSSATGSFSIGSVSGQYGSGSGSFQITCTADQATEGNEQFDIHLYSDSNRTVNVASLYGLTVNDTSTAPPPAFILTYHGYGSSIRPLNIYYVRSSNSSVFLLGTLGTNGQTHSSSSAAWSTATYSLANYVGVPGQVAIVAQANQSTQYQGDWGISGAYRRADGVTEDWSAAYSSNWRHNGIGYSTATGAAAAGVSQTLSTSGQYWSIDSGGSTPSINTGPSSAPSGSGSYIYWETSNFSHGNQYTYAALKRRFSITP